MAVISIEDLHVFYEDNHALRGVSCAIEGGAVGLLGPNGAGKSTLLKTLLGFVRAEAGSARVFGMEMPDNALAVRQRLGYMPERESMSPKVSAVSFLTYCGTLFGMSRADAMERAHEVLNYVGVSESRYRNMETYSTGMCQRVKFAQSLVHDPKLLLLDEPTSGLDPEAREEMLERVDELAHKRKVTVLLSTHLLPDVERVCDRVIMINKGRIALEGEVASLMTPREGMFELRVRENKDAYMHALAEAGCGCRDQLTGTLLVNVPDTTVAAAQSLLYGLARNVETQVRHFKPVRQTLEEVFIEAINSVEVE